MILQSPNLDIFWEELHTYYQSHMRQSLPAHDCERLFERCKFKMLDKLYLIHGWWPLILPIESPGLH